MKNITAFLFCLLLSSVSFSQSYAATYYVDFGSGSDSNNGTSTSTPWQHCPGDANYTGSTVFNPGDKVIFKGGVVYNGEIEIKWSGNSTNVITYDGNSAGTFGTGQAIIDGEGQTLGSSAYQYGFYGKTLNGVGVSYVLINNFEIRDMRYIYPDNTGAQALGIYFNGAGTNIEIKNCNIHNIKPASVPLNTTIANPAAFLTSVSIPDSQTLTDTAANFSSPINYATTAGKQAVYKVLLAWNPTDYYSAWGYVGPLNGSNDSLTIYQDINLTTPGWNFSEPYNPIENISGTAATTSGSTLTDNSANFTATGAVNAGVDYLRIGATDYPITQVNSANELTVTGNLGTGSGVSYSIVRHYFYWIYSLAGGASYIYGGLDIETTGYSNVYIHDNMVQDAKYGIAANCNWGVVCNNINIYNNDISATSLGIQGSPGGAGVNLTNVNIYNNTIHGFAAWSLYDWTYHRDGIYLWGSSSGTSTLSGLNIYNNVFYGNIGIDDVTAQLYLEYYIQNINIYNNVFAMTSATGGYTLEIAGSSTTSPTISNVGVYNNTFAKVPGDGMHGVRFAELGNVTMENNIFYLYESYGADFTVDTYTVSNGFVSDYNLLTSANPYSEDLQVNGINYSLAAWQSADLSFAHDVHSVISQNPVFNNFPLFAAQVASTGTTTSINLTPNTNTNYNHTFNQNDYVEYNGDGVVRQVTAVNGNTITISPALSQNSQAEDEIVDWGNNSNFTINAALKSGSPGIGAGTNLSSIIGSSDIAGNSRPASGNWDIGAYQYSTYAPCVPAASDCYQAKSLAASDIINAINAAEAANGGTVELPAGIATISTPIVETIAKNLLITGASQTQTVIDDSYTAAAMFQFTVNGNVLFHIENMTLNLPSTDAFLGALQVKGTSFNKLISNITFNQTGNFTEMLFLGSFLDATNGGGVVSNCIFYAPPTTPTGNTGIAISVQGSAQNTSVNYGGTWENSPDWGSLNKWYIENNVFNLNNYPYSVVMDAYYGAKFIFRDNTVNGSWIDEHGYDSGSMSVHSSEIYDNTFTSNASTSLHSVSTYLNIRGGTHLVWGNTFDSNYGYEGPGFELTYYRSASSDAADYGGALYYIPPAQGEINPVSKGECLSGGGNPNPGGNPFDGNQDNTGWPCYQQPGMTGANGTTASPVIQWNNLVAGADPKIVYNPDFGPPAYTFFPNESNQIIEGRDYLNDTTCSDGVNHNGRGINMANPTCQQFWDSVNNKAQGYVPAPYPHPLLARSFSTTASIYSLNVSIALNGSGTISSLPAGINCSGTCDALFDSSSTPSVTLTAVPASGYTFTGWSGGGCGGSGTCTVTINSNQTVTANFTASSGTPLYGDVIDSGRVTIYDAELTAQYAIGLTVPGFDRAHAQVDGNSTVDIYDAYLIAEYAIGLITKFAAVQP